MSKAKATRQLVAPYLLPFGVLLFSALAMGACASGDDGDVCPRGRGIADVKALDTTRMQVTFACRVDAESAQVAANYEVGDLAVQPAQMLAVLSAKSADSSSVVLTTDPQDVGTTYTLRVDGVKDAAGNAVVGTRNFTGSGSAVTAPLTFRLDDSEKADVTEASLLLSVDPATGAFNPGLNKVQLLDADGDHIWEAVLNVAVDPLRTAATDDDNKGPEYIGYTARVADAAGQPLSELAIFEVKEAVAQTVNLLRLGIKPPPGGTVRVTFRVDDRPAQALLAPSLVASFDAEGTFNIDSPTTITLSDDDGDDVWEGEALVKIDPNRVEGGDQPATFPYSVILMEGGQEHPGRFTEFGVVNADAKVVEILMGNVDKVPVTFRVDVKNAWLNLTGSKKGLYAGEAVFLTGGFGPAEDAFGNNTSDDFSGGETLGLQMVERSDHPGVWERTIFLNKSRPYSWKVVRCPKDAGCSLLNKTVISSGTAFPTVMKNLVTELCDVSRDHWTDTECKSPKLIDPRDLSQVDTGQGTLNYSSATIHEGTGAGLNDQQDPSNTPNAALMFKQEIPDFIAQVTTEPVVTPVYVIGTWRDVNIAGTPEDMLSGGVTVDLDDTDYDAGFIGSFPPSYELSGTVDPPDPVVFDLDGALDSEAKQVAGNSSTMKIHAAVSGKILYIATDDAGEGSDHFLLVSATAPTGSRPAPWGKAGTVPTSSKMIFVADENDSDFAGIFEFGTPDTMLADASTSTTQLGVATPTQNGGVLEAVINLETLFGTMPTSIWVVVGPWDTNDAGVLYGPALAGAANNEDGNVDADEMLELSISNLEVK
ncbi:MAG: hypothetical protein JRH20_00655 [Deltaproteobacteria bacterium]|nr:hypothetical protein [Deltaproteobacteria bacterium]